MLLFFSTLENFIKMIDFEETDSFLVSFILISLITDDYLLLITIGNPTLTYSRSSYGNGNGSWWPAKALIKIEIGQPFHSSPLKQ